MRACWAAALTAGLPLLLAACATAPRATPGASSRAERTPTVLPAHPPDISGIPDAVPRWEPRSSLGNPRFYEVDGHRYFVLASASGYAERGVASWYGPQFHGLRTATGEPYDMFAMTAAHKTLPLPCYARVTNLENGRSVIVRINDRGPFVANRIIDLSYTAAVKLGMIRTGTAFVEVQTLTPPPGPLPGPGPLPTPGPLPLPVSLPASSPAVAAAAAGVSSVPALSSQETAALPPVPAGAPAALPSTTSPRAAAAARASVTLSMPPGLYIQVGAFARLANARQAAQRLRTAGVRQVFTLAPGAHQPLLRVRVGPVDSVQQFDALLAKLRALGFAGARLAPD